MLLFVGLGNPGPKYEMNRHNLGFLVVDEIASSYGFSPFRARFQGLYAEGQVGGEKIAILKPATFMNESGRAVGEASRFYKLDPSAVFVFHDELDLKPGKIKVKQGGGAGGHNGLKSVDAHIGKNYWRVRLGIGHPGDKDRVLGWVLQDFTKADKAEWLPKLIEAAADEADRLVAGDMGAYMSRVAHAVFPPPPKPPKPPKPVADAPATDGNGAGTETVVSADATRSTTS